MLARDGRSGSWARSGWLPPYAQTAWHNGIEYVNIMCGRVIPVCRQFSATSPGGSCTRSGSS